MRFIRYHQGNSPLLYGWVYEDLVGPVEGNIFQEFRRLEANIPINMVKLAAPLLPGKIIGVQSNYEIKLPDAVSQKPEVPILFIKPDTTVIGTGDSIVLPPQSRFVAHEAELAVVVGKQGRWIDIENAMEFVFGYTVANDVTAYDLLEKDGQVTRAKSFDTFCPLGPWIETDLDATDVLMTCRVNGEMRQMASTREMVFTIPQLITYVSSVMTIYPGDLILTGSPAGSEQIQPGDIVEVNIEGIGELKNLVSGGTIPS